MDNLLHGTGAIKDTPDERDYKWADHAKLAGVAQFDWEKGYDVEEDTGIKITVKNQNGSSSCGGQAWAYYGQVLDPEHVEKSAKFIYANTNAPGGGSAARTNSDFVCKKGWGDESLTPSYMGTNLKIPPSEAFMTYKEDITSEAYEKAILDKGLSYAYAKINIDEIAQAIANNKGCIIGISGQNNGTWRTKFPQKPAIIDNTSWSHWVYCGKAKMIDGKKYIGFINSWGEDVGDEGWQWISEDYINMKYAIWCATTLVYDFQKFKFTKTLKFGSTGNEVKELQKALGVIQTGNFLWLTFNAVKSFQKLHGLLPDGIVGEKTRSILNELLKN